MGSSPTLVKFLFLIFLFSSPKEFCSFGQLPRSYDALEDLLKLSPFQQVRKSRWDHLHLSRLFYEVMLDHLEAANLELSWSWYTLGFCTLTQAWSNMCEIAMLQQCILENMSRRNCYARCNIQNPFTARRHKDLKAPVLRPLQSGCAQGSLGSLINNLPASRSWGWIFVQRGFHRAS